MKLTMIRHAESIYNKKKIFQGQTNCSLSEKGINDTKEKSKNFYNNFDVCFCSPLKRTKQTAEILVPYLNINYDERLMEMGLGDWENTPVSDEKRVLLKNKVIPPNGETYESLDKRILEFLEMLKANYNNENILIITHAGIIYAIHRILGLKCPTIDNLEIISIEI